MVNGNADSGRKVQFVYVLYVCFEVFGIWLDDLLW